MEIKLEKYAQKIKFNNNKIVKYYNLNLMSNLELVAKYCNELKMGKVHFADTEVKKINDIVCLEQEYIKGINLEDFLFYDSLKNKHLSYKSKKLFTEFIAYYFEKIYILKNIKVDCKLSNFIINDNKFCLVDVVPALFVNKKNEEILQIMKVCFNEDLQIKNIISYWIKSYVRFSYPKIGNEKQQNTHFYKDIKFMFDYVNSYYNLFQNSTSDKNDIQRFEILKNVYENNLSFNFIKKHFVKSTFSKSQNLVDDVLNIHIIGGPATGKSYVAKLLTEQYDSKLLNLDDIFWDKNTKYFGVHNDKETRNKALESFLENKNKIVEGCYLDWVDKSFEHVEKIFFIKSNPKLQRKRILIRFIKRKLGIEKIEKKESFKSICGLIKWVDQYNEIVEKTFSDLIQKYNDKLIILDNNFEIFKYL